MKKLYGIVVVVLLCTSAIAQITINQSNAPSVGTSFTGFSTADEVNWAPGSGGNQNWNISSFTFTEDYSATYVAPGTTPFAGMFPTATICEDYYQSTYTYFRVASDGLYYLGFVVPTDSTPFVQQPEAEVRYLPFPCTNGTTWSSVMRMSSEIIPGFTYTTIDSSVFTVDGWGNMTTPNWSASALRLYDHGWISILLNGMPIGEPSEDWSYSFITENPARNVNYISFDATGPNFTTGSIDYSTSGIVSAEHPRGPVSESFKLSQNYPNPFNPSTTLPIELAKSAKVELTIYNEVGQIVSHAAHELSAGSHSLPIDGSAWGSGSYFAKVMAGNEVQSTRMVLVK